MINSKLVSLLKTLSPTEMKELKDYINSPFFNKNRKVVALFDHIRKFYPDFSNNSLTDQSISAVIFPGMKHDYFKIRNLTSDLFSLAKDFLAHLYYKEALCDSRPIHEKFQKGNGNGKDTRRIFSLETIGAEPAGTLPADCKRSA